MYYRTILFWQRQKGQSQGKGDNMSKEVKQLPKRSEAQLPETLSDKGKQKVEKYGWPFFKAGIILTNTYDCVLLVKEAKEKQLVNGEEKWVPTDDGKWNLPCGRLQEWENFERGADREGGEESGFDFDIVDICHIGFRSDINNPYIIVIYHAIKPHDISITDPPNPEEIADRQWFSHGDIIALRDSHQLRNAELILSAMDNLRAGKTIPPEAITVYGSKFASE